MKRKVLCIIIILYKYNRKNVFKVFITLDKYIKGKVFCIIVLLYDWVNDYWFTCAIQIQNFFA